MKNLSASKERILQYIDSKGISKRQFYQETGISNGTLDQKSDITLKTIEKIISKYRDIDIRWLISGEGGMLREKQKSTINQSITGDNNTMSGHDTLTQDCENLIPLYRKIIEEKEEQIRIKDEQIKKLLEIMSSK